MTADQVLSPHPTPALVVRTQGSDRSLQAGPLYRIGRDPDSLTSWRRDLGLLAAEPNTTVKISALGVNDHAWTVGSIRRIVLDTIDVFGPDRCMFASNFPVDGLYSTLPEIFAAFDTITDELDQHERVDLFAGTARRFYRID